MRLYVYSILIVLFVFTNFISDSSLTYITGLTAIIALLISFSYAKGIFFYSGISFLVIGFGLYIYNVVNNDLPWYHIFLYFEPMLGMLSLFLILPFINSLILVGKYDKNLSQFLQQRTKNLSGLYRKSFIVCHFLGLFLNIATIPLLSRSLSKTLHQIPKKSAQKFYTQNLLRAYALCLMWNPLEVMVVTSLDITNIAYFKLFPVIITIVILFILVDWIISHLKSSKISLKTENAINVNLKKVYKKMVELIFLLFFLVTIVTYVQHILNKSFLFSIVLVLIPVSFVWSFFIKKSKRFLKITIPHWKVRTIGLSNYFFMFLSAGFFIEMIEYSNTLFFLQSSFIKGSEDTLLFYFMIGGYFLTASLIGFHPLVSLTLLASLLSPILLKVSSISFAVVLITCSLASVMYSPFNLSVSILADQLKLNSYRLGMWNILFAISFMILSIIIAYNLSLFI